MPRLRDRTVLNAGVIDMPLHWQIDAFALAAGYDDAAGRYVGLWLPDEGKNAAPAATDSPLLVRPDVAVQQRADEVPTPDPVKLPDENDKTDETHEKKTFKPDPDHRGVHHREPKTRFYGVKTLNSDKIAVDFKNVVEEIIANLRQDGINLVVKIEIEATKTTGFEEGQVRTVSENAGTLKFDQSGFEET